MKTKITKKTEWWKLTREELKNIPLFRSRIAYDGIYSYSCIPEIALENNYIELKNTKENWIEAILTHNDDPDLNISTLRRMKKAGMIYNFAYKLNNK